MLNRDRFFSRDEKKDTKVQKTSPAPYPYNPAEAAKPTATASIKELPAGVETSGSKLIVGPNIKLKGVEITDCDTLVVEGHVEATMDSRAIQIAPTGSFNGTASIDYAEIHGQFSGELTVRKRLIIHATGKVSGRVRYGKVIIEEGGEISGEIKTLAAAEDVRRSPLLANSGIKTANAAH